MTADQITYLFESLKVAFKAAAHLNRATEYGQGETSHWGASNGCPMDVMYEVAREAWNLLWNGDRAQAFRLTPDQLRVSDYFIDARELEKMWEDLKAAFTEWPNGLPGFIARRVVRDHLEVVAQTIAERFDGWDLDYLQSCLTGAHLGAGVEWPIWVCPHYGEKYLDLNQKLTHEQVMILVDLEIDSIGQQANEDRALSEWIG